MRTVEHFAERFGKPEVAGAAIGALAITMADKSNLGESGTNMADGNEALHIGDVEETVKLFGTMAVWKTMLAGARVATFVADTLRGPRMDAGQGELAAEAVVAE
ncbi:MAG TPA: hypothetical protein V6C72_12265 [Chroococcales cyanobacterium]